MGRPDTLRRLGDLARAVAYRQALIRHERWSRPRLEKFQYRQLTRLLDWVTHKSPFYLKLCQTLNISKPFDLQDFPIMDKQAHMQHFDQLVTDPRLRLSQIHDHLACLSSDEYYLGEYRALTTAGSSGHRAVFVSNRKEWSLQQAASMRIAAMMGIFLCSVKRPRIVTIGSPSPLHDSYRLPLSMDIGLYHYHMLPATTPVDELVWKLNTLKPDLLRGFPSMLGLLASEQLQCHLQINPRFIAGGGEALTEEMRRQLRHAWPQCAIYDIYGTQEGIRSMECSPGGGMHLFEDLGIIEVVDECNRPVPDGNLGHKILFTNLYSFTLPIIRYEISDMVNLDTKSCLCGRPFRRIGSINGRNDDVIYLQGHTGGQVAVHPVQFWDVLESYSEIRQYQVIQENDGIHLSLVFEEGNEVVVDSVRKRLEQELQTLGASNPAIHIKPVANLGDRSGNMGKWKNIISNMNQLSL